MCRRTSSIRILLRWTTQQCLALRWATASGTLSTRIFAGPKALNVLQSIHGVNGPSLEKVVNFGWWGVIAKPLFAGLRYIHRHVVANWGWAILLLTLVLNLAMLPTRFQMMKSSLKMQRIQPQMDAIKAKYAKFKATDPRKQEMQKEMFALQKQEGVNMFGGCLPMLIQWPLLFGFYRVLENVIELRQCALALAARSFGSGPVVYSADLCDRLDGASQLSRHRRGWIRHSRR